MDGFWVFLALAGVVFVFLGPIGFFLTISARGRLQIAERKILALEAHLRVAQGLPAAAPGTQTGEAPSVDSGAKRNGFKRSGFGRLCQAL